jgi:glycosyltransferase involved in cell wall biosynthesis
VLRVVIVTQGDPSTVSGGFLYHRRVAERAAGEDAAVHFVSVPARRYPLAVVDGPAVVRRAAHDADVVVVDSLASNTLGPLLLAVRRWLPPLVGSVHQVLGGSDGPRLRRAVQAGADRLAWRSCRALVVPSDLLARQLLDAGVRTPAHVVAPGRDVAVVAPRPGPTDASTDLRHGRRIAVLCVANWHPRKGIAAVLDAVARVPDGAVALHLVGDEDVDPAHRRELLSRIDQPELRRRVVRHGTVDPARMGALYRGADAFVLASTEEPYGIVYGEAMSAGLPVVGWDAGNLPALVDDGVEGRVLPVGDVTALAAALVELAHDEATRARLGAAARARADTLPTWDDTARRFFDVCRAAAT